MGTPTATSVTESPVSTPAVLCARADALDVLPLFEAFAAEIEADGTAQRRSYHRLWESADQLRSLEVEITDVVHPDGTTSQQRALLSWWPRPDELEAFRQGMAGLIKLGMEIGRHEAGGDRV